jgi:hypothetical protein
MKCVNAVDDGNIFFCMVLEYLYAHQYSETNVMHFSFNLLPAVPLQAWCIQLT